MPLDPRKCRPGEPLHERPEVAIVDRTPLHCPRRQVFVASLGAESKPDLSRPFQASPPCP
ncbi:putative pollen-specific leucine-rich repeat extensin-like protein 3 [Iris pallida]|uniref:Pollen-specific leucine-rich repeat extensin-like protein 3 n=1 Tax=Iris pallida TaxID=29817 RepID=A0AAX6ERV8_IRIPA|nr:putative pollen-specific leucine-rich repeat extensin-like protein 3 [Iris pallida]KAJ6820474.1 putative pollen-specific leucine-rich repeat extensin-like protein 3 [Iris pallida]